MNTARLAIAVLSFSAAGLVGIATREGWCGQACADPVHGMAVPTIGFGSTEGVKAGDKITPVQAVQRTLREVQAKEGALKRCIKVDLAQYEYDAYVELAHNIGEGAFCRSTLVRKLNARDYVGACDQILAWNKAGDVDCSEPGNKVCPGLWQDRLRLHRKCNGAAS